MESVKISVTLPKEALERLDTLSAAYMLKRSAMITMAINEKYEGFDVDGAKNDLKK